MEELRRVLEAPAKGEAHSPAEHDAARLEASTMEATARLRSFTPEEMARSGCRVLVSYDGLLHIERGLIRPGSDLGGVLPAGAATAPSAGDDPDGDELRAEPQAEAAPEISGALAQTVSEWQTVATARALADDPDLALRVMLAAFHSYGSPARLGRQGWHGLHSALRDKAPGRNVSFGDELASVLQRGLPHVKAALAVEIAYSLDLTAAAALHPAHAVKETRPLVDALDAEGYLKAARQVFEPGVYFDRAPAAVALAAVIEMGGRKPSGKKAQVALEAADLARKLGWLPPGLRSAAYVPPRAPGAPAVNAEVTPRGRRSAPAGAAATA